MIVTLPEDGCFFFVQEFDAALPMIEDWGVFVSNPRKTFQEIDVNGGGQILFGEFANWALQNSLDE